MHQQESVANNETTEALLRAQFAGIELVGDNLTPEQVQRWYDQEETGYFDLRANYYGAFHESHKYEYEALNHLHAGSMLLKQRFRCCVALGCAAGDDVVALAPVVDRFVAIEPAEKWWKSEIGGKPATYLKPAVMGGIDLPSNSADLATSFGVLHHIPNVSDVTREIARVLRPGGLFVIREPITWMGDWRHHRPGLTANERGLPARWFESKAREIGFSVVRRHYCMFRPVSVIARKLGVAKPFRSPTATFFDWICSELFFWNIHYKRDNLAKKIAPASAFWILRKER